MKFRHTNFMRLIYATLLALPFVAILSRVIYVQSNKNAYQSAEITTTTYTVGNKYDTNEVNSIDDLKKGRAYTFKSNFGNGDFQNDVNFSFIVIDGKDLNYYEDSSQIYVDENLFYEKNVFNIEFYNYTCLFTVYNGYVTEIDASTVYTEGITVILDDYTITNTDLINNISDYFGIAEYNEEIPIEVESTTLDNVFEYSVNKFIENNNFGKINLFQWTTDLFFDSNDVNNMYVGFINWYLNYTLLVSATYILFLVLMWFINYARRLLERGMNYDW